MDIALLQRSITEACEIWRITANNVVHMELHPDVARLDLCCQLLGQLCDLIGAARNELIHGLQEGKLFEEEHLLLLQISINTDELSYRLQSASQALDAASRLLIMGKLAQC